MKNTIRSKNHLLRNKRKYLFLFTLLIIGIISGIIFIFLLSGDDRSLIKENYRLIFSSDSNINYMY